MMEELAPREHLLFATMTVAEAVLASKLKALNTHSTVLSAILRLAQVPVDSTWMPLCRPLMRLFAINPPWMFCRSTASIELAVTSRWFHSQMRLLIVCPLPEMSSGRPAPIAVLWVTTTVLWVRDVIWIAVSSQLSLFPWIV